jgi:hypothetical protein
VASSAQTGRYPKILIRQEKKKDRKRKEKTARRGSAGESTRPICFWGFGVFQSESHWGRGRNAATQRSKKRNNAKPRPVPQAKSERKEAKTKENKTKQNNPKSTVQPKSSNEGNSTGGKTNPFLP